MRILNALSVISILLLLPTASVSSNVSKRNEKLSNENKTTKISLLIGAPINASVSPKEQNHWFSRLAEWYLHFRLEAIKTIDIIPSGKVHQSLIQSRFSTLRTTDKYKRIAHEYATTHVLIQNYEFSRDMKMIHYYAELLPLKDSAVIFEPFEKDFPIENIASVMDSCVLWFCKSSGIAVRQQELIRFFGMNILSKNPKDIKSIGTIIENLKTMSLAQGEAGISQLISIAENDPRNLLALYVAAILYEQYSRYKNAVAQLENLLAIFPHYAPFYTAICRNYRLWGKSKEALLYAANAEKRGIITPELLLEGAKALEVAGRYDKAEKAFSRVLLIDPQQQHALLFFARNYNKKKNPQKALTYADHILRINSHNGPAYLEKGKALIMLKKYDDAREMLTKSISYSTDSVEQLHYIADIYTIEKDYAQAAHYYQNALHGNEKNFSLYMLTADSWEKADRAANALKVMQKAAVHFPDSSIIQKRIGLVSYQLGDTSTALTALEKCLRKRREDAEVLMVLGNIYTEKGAYDKAFYMYNHALPQLADKTRGTFALGVLYLKKGDTGAAIANFKQIIKQNPHYPHIHRYLADAWNQEHNLHSALKEYKKARYFDSTDQYIQKQIALIYFRMHEFNAASRELTRLLSLGNNDADTYYYRAIAQLHLRKVDNAESSLNKAYSLGKPDAKILYLLGLGYNTALKKSEAIKAFEQSVQLNPKNQAALLELSKAYQEEKKYRAAAETNIKLYESDTGKYLSYLAEAGFLFEKVHDTAQARKSFTAYVACGQSNDAVILHLAKIEYFYTMYPTVISLLQRLTPEKISEHRDMFMFAHSYFMTKQYNDAIPWFRKVLVQSKNHTDAYTMLAVSYEEIGDYKNAVQTCTEMIKLLTGEQQATCGYKIAVLYQRLGRLDEAIVKYVHNIKLYPFDLRNYDQLIAIYRENENWPRAREILEKSITLPEIPVRYHKRLAEVYLKLNDKVNAVKQYITYLEKDSSDADVLYQLGALYNERNVYNKAIVLLEKANLLRPDNYAIVSTLANAYHRSANISRATVYFEQAYRLDTTQTEVLSYLAVCYRTSGYEKKLAHTLRRLTAAQPDNYAVNVELGMVLLNQDSVNEATKVLENACRINPDNADAHVILAQIYEKNGNDNGRFSHLKRAFAAHPQNPDVLVQLGRFYHDQNQRHSAIEHINKAIALNPQHAEALYEYSLILFEEHKAEEALRVITRAVTLDSYNSRFLMLNAQILYTLDKKEQALSLIEKALPLDSTNTELLAQAGYYYRAVGRTDDAKRILFKAIAVSDQCYKCFMYLGDIFLEEIQCAHAAGLFRRALDITGYNEEVMMKLGRTLILSYQYSDAADVFKKVLQKNPKHHEAWYRLMHIHALQGDMNKVTQIFGKRPHDDKTVWDHLAIGEMHEIEQNYAAARISYTVAMRLSPALPEAHAGIGRVFLAEGKYTDAIACFNAAHEKDPYNPYLLLDLGRAHEKKGEFSSARALYAVLLDKYAHIPDTYCLIAEMQSRDKEHLQAVTIVKKGLAQNPQNAALYTTLGKEYHLLGEYENAITAYEKAFRYGGQRYVEVLVKIATIYHHNLHNQKEAKKYIKKYLKKGGDKREIEENNLAHIDT